MDDVFERIVKVRTIDWRLELVMASGEVSIFIIFRISIPIVLFNLIGETKITGLFEIFPK